MPKPVSRLRVPSLAGHAVLNAYARGGSAVSPEARAARKAATAVVESAERSQALFGEKAAALSGLRALAQECAEEGWDGAAAFKLNSLALFIAEEFVRALPDGVPLPEFAPEPDGSVSLDWIESRNRLFSVSIGAARRFAYAWLDGSERGHGVAVFDGERIPPMVLEGIRGIADYGIADIGSP